MKRFISTSIIFLTLSSGVVLKADGPPEPIQGSGDAPKMLVAPSDGIFAQILTFLGLA